jgi:hypothetical protein
MSFYMARSFNDYRYPELVSGSISKSRPSVPHKAELRRRVDPEASEETCRWILKQVQGDGVWGVAS